jgi:hypothetical protein
MNEITITSRKFGLGLLLSTALFALVSLFGTAAIASASPAYVGFQTHSLWFQRSNDEMTHELNMIQEVGGNVVRVDVGWSSLESDAKGQRTGWYLEKLDRFVAEANSRGIKVLATLVTTPCWASSAPETLKQGCSGAWWERGVQNYPPTNPQDFADAAHFITQRYGTELAALELWNEPNTERFLIAPNRAVAYAKMVKAAYPAAKAGNPAVPVLVGALASADRPFLEELYGQGIQGYYDGISVHPYNEWRNPYDLWQPQWKQYTFLPGMEWIHQAQEAAGDTKPMWVTEFGWDTCTGSSWCVSEAQQATYTAQAFQILNTLPYVEGAVDYELRDESTNKAEFEGNWGLVHTDFSPKPGFALVQQQLHGMLAAIPVTLEVEVAASGAVVAVGKAPAQHQAIEVKVGGCKAHTESIVTTSEAGRYRHKLGSVDLLAGCSVKAKAVRSNRSVVRRIPSATRLAIAGATPAKD